MNHPSTAESSVTPSRLTESKRRSFLWRLLRVLLCVVIGLVTLLALFYEVENFRGKRAWAAYQKEMDAKGGIPDYRKLAPPPVPDDQNFAMTPFLAPLLDFLPGTQTYRDTNAFERLQRAFDRLPGDPRNRGDWRKGERTDFGVWLAAFDETENRAAGKPATTNEPPPAVDRSQAAAAILASLKEYEPILDELRAASQRPHARFNLCYDLDNPSAILLPHLAKLRTIVRILSLRASAELAGGQPQPALDDLALTFFLADAIRNEPILISHLVRCAILQHAMQPLWEGCADRRWSEAQLAALEQRLARFDFLADDLQAMRGERAFGNAIISFIRRDPRMLERLGEPNPGNGEGTGPVGLLIPRGWLLFEQVNYNRLFDERILPGINPETRRVDVEVIDGNGKFLEESLRQRLSAVTGHRVLSSMLLPALTQVHRKFVYVQTFIDQARMACALERFRLATGQYPASTAELAPRFLDRLPQDLISGEPLKYRQTDGGGFLLYGVGWNQKDDGGETALSGKVKGRESVEITEGDWVWRRP